MFKQRGVDGLVLSLDTEKAFNCIEWPYLFSVLIRFGLGDNLFKWIRILYDHPRAAVITNGLRSDSFITYRGTRQGCPLSPLLFAMALEPLAEAIRSSTSI